MIISFDVGIKNLAYCILKEDLTIIKWNIIDISGKDIYDQSKVLFEQLKQIMENKTESESANISTCLIENQPCTKNPRMKSIQIMIYSFWALNNIDTYMVSAVNKLKVNSNINKSEKLNYTQKKKKGIELASIYIANTNQTDEIREQFNNSKKKDDLADSFLQAVSWLKK
jgi:hypothetical protein